MTVEQQSHTSPTALIVHAHPEPQSFSTAQMTAAAEGLTDRGYHVDILDLYQDGFSPILGKEEFGLDIPRFKPVIEQERAYRDGTLAADVKKHLAMLMEADLVLLSFPLWWYSAPAILKGWLDRILIPEALYSEEKEFETGGLYGSRAQMLITTGVEAEYYGRHTRYGDLDDHFLPLRRSLEYIGLDVLETIVTWKPTGLTKEERIERLQEISDGFRNSALPSAKAGTTA